MGTLKHIRQDGFASRLAEAATWSDLFLSKDHAIPFRSKELTPDGALTGTEAYSEAVATICLKRVSLLKERNIPVVLPTIGKLLLYYPQRSLFDGAAEAASEGFFDANNEPPRDTWIYYAQGLEVDNEPCLVSWVPSSYTELAQSGISVNPEGCIEWATESLHPVLFELGQSKLLS